MSQKQGEHYFKQETIQLKSGLEKRKNPGLLFKETTLKKKCCLGMTRPETHKNQKNAKGGKTVRPKPSDKSGGDVKESEDQPGSGKQGENPRLIYDTEYSKDDPGENGTINPNEP